MTSTIRAIILFVITNATLAFIFLIPKHPDIKPSAIVMDLPEKVDDWVGKSTDPSQREIEVLGTDTQFERKYYVRLKSQEDKTVDVLDASIVLSGHDMNRSIHRAERCLKAQGFTIVDSSSIKVLVNYKPIKIKKLKSFITLNDGKKLETLLFYWFVGYKTITHDHYTRTLVDMKDRIFKGYDQRWGYISIQIPLREYEIGNGYKKVKYTEEQAVEVVKDFIANVFDKIHNLEQITSHQIAKD